MGYAQLQALDTNGDGVLDQDDEGFKRLSIWQDKNSNQITDEGELQSLQSHGIVSLGVNYSIKAEWQNGNLLLEASKAKRIDGSELEMRDAYFAVQEIEPVSPPKEIKLTANVLRDGTLNLDLMQQLQGTGLALNANAASYALKYGQPEHGRVRKLDESNVRYEPRANYMGVDRFSFELLGGNQAAQQAGQHALIKGQVLVNVVSHLNPTNNSVMFVAGEVEATPKRVATQSQTIYRVFDSRASNIGANAKNATKQPTSTPASNVADQMPPVEIDWSVKPTFASMKLDRVDLWEGGKEQSKGHTEDQLADATGLRIRLD
jgi:cell division septation protein DedD